MELVVQYQPNNYMALYHAGMSNYVLGHLPKAISQLERFRKLYKRGDFFGKQADKAIERMRAGEGPDAPNPGAH